MGQNPPSMTANLSYLASLGIFTFGAITFSILTAYYLGEIRRRGRARRPTVLPVFTCVCAVAFLNNLLFQTMMTPVGTWASFAVAVAGGIATALIPPLMVHLVFEVESRALPASGKWKWCLFAFYGIAICAALARDLNENAILTVPWSDALYQAPAAMLAAAAAGGLLLQALSRRPLPASERTHRSLVRILLAAMLVCAAASLTGFGMFIGQLPDYLLLAFFCVTLYYRERLVFFDLLVKQSIFLGLGLAAVTVCFSLATGFPWIYALGILIFWLIAPWVYSHVARAVDHLWLRRPYSAVDAERQFIRDIQAATTEEELRLCAASSLAEIFRTSADVRLDGMPVVNNEHGEDTLAAELGHADAGLGSIGLATRPDGILFLSDDRRLLQSLAGALGVVLETVRSRIERRGQEEREQRLRWLATRSELKALRAQINPHFLFNSLSVIAGLIQYHPELADETIEQLAQVFRYTLRKSENEWAHLAEEVEFVTAYLRIEQARFGERLKLNLYVEPAAARLLIPAMSMQPLIENAIKHGVSAVEGPGIVGLRAVLEHELLSVEVSDNGPGFPTGFSLDEPGDGYGLRNVRERLRGYYGDCAQLSWESGLKGTRVIMTLPQTPAFGSTCGDALDTSFDC